MKYSIITVTWKSKDDILRLIESFKKHIHSSDYEVIVVDNNSQDGTVEILNELYPEVKIIANNYNAGYAGGMNQGYKISKGEYLFFMNPDMEIHENSFEVLIQELNQHSHIGIIAPQLRYGDGQVQPTIKNEPSLSSQILILSKLHHFIKTKSLKKYLATDFDYTRSQEVDRLMGAFIGTTREKFEIFGPWDEDYPLWWEDEQLCKDSKAAGYINVYFPSTYITHFEGKSFAQVLSTSKQKRFNKGMRIYFKKNNGIFAYTVLLLIHPISMLLAYLVQIFKIQPRSQSKAAR